MTHLAHVSRESSFEQLGLMYIKLLYIYVIFFRPPAILLLPPPLLLYTHFLGSSRNFIYLVSDPYFYMHFCLLCLMHILLCLLPLPEWSVSKTDLTLQFQIPRSSLVLIQPVYFYF